jgi:hypothetical protein
MFKWSFFVCVKVLVVYLYIVTEISTPALDLPVPWTVQLPDYSIIQIYDSSME